MRKPVPLPTKPIEWNVVSIQKLFLRLIAKPPESRRAKSLAREAKWRAARALPTSEEGVGKEVGSPGAGPEERSRLSMKMRSAEKESSHVVLHRRFSMTRWKSWGMDCSPKMPQQNWKKVRWREPGLIITKPKYLRR